LRIDGTLQTFGAEGLARLRFERSRRYIKVEIQIPEAVWRPLNASETKLYLVRQVRAAIAACIERLEKDKHPVAKTELYAQMESAFDEYLSNVIPIHSRK